MNQSFTVQPLDYRHLFTKYMGPLRWQVMGLAVVLCIGIGLDLLGPHIMRNFIDGAQSNVGTIALLQLASIFLGATLLNQLMSIIEAYLTTDVSFKATNRLRSDLTQHSLSLDLNFHHAHTPGELIERVDGDVVFLSNFFSRFVLQIISSVLLLAGILVMLFRVNGQIGAAITIYVVLVFALFSRLLQVSVPYWGQIRDAFGRFSGFLEERLSGTEDLRANGAIPYTMRRFYEHGRELFFGFMKAFMIVSSISSSNLVFFAVGTVLSLGMGIYFYSQGQITLGTVFLIFSYTELLSRPIEQILDQVGDLQQAGGSIVRIQKLLSIPATIVDGPGAELPHQAPKIEFDEVSFTYSEERGAANVLTNISFMIEPGATLGILGRTGSGKTTIARLLARLWEPTAGEIRLGGIPVQQATLAELGDYLSFVTQDVHLFHASLRHNLTLFNPTISDQRILQALDELGLRSWYNSLPAGLDTVLTAGDDGLSAGESQLLAVTRVFLKDPKVVILDEPTSRLDPMTEQRLGRAIAHLVAGRTGIIIAHRLTTVQVAGDILILEDGRIVEQGNRDELMHNPNSRFAQLYRTSQEGAVA
ncbi:ABC transporter ATP-binding protein/permease [Chloroflexi bacterium TSY]|nr:ABC transporter ATP-binding protein/permease [Chloroflexi bacterium TSY]